MENLVVTTFQGHENAMNGLNRLKELDQLHDITIYHVALIRKTNDDQFEFLHQEGADTTAYPITGMAAGTAIGAIGGPVGMMIGMLTGGLLGAADGMDTDAFSEDFLHKVNSHVTPGTFVLIADVEEDSEFMINSYLQPYGGTSVHTPITDQWDQYNQEQWDELDNEIDEAEKELKAANEQHKAAIQAKLERLKDEKQKKLAAFKTRAAQTKDKLQERVDNLDQKMKNVADETKAKIKKHQQAVKNKLDKVTEKMADAFDE
ncbi:MAG: DUF1269 domain-containing protein [Chitinophaga sp.]|uniref:DUF1269 domain-containing protein n=1 Tax=Chitinophaga sp. TaxID=1869181 RepID=UPI0025C6C4DC|nr:DUF1269 domain-containing protein [Chitinophaga sp.]MBV8251391.1 DUF1269 domain-containing protein [Chitinophaga sp.]